MRATKLRTITCSDVNAWWWVSYFPKPCWHKLLFYSCSNRYVKQV